jgi:hypothetical protein
MSLILDGTNGLSDVDGTAATPAIRGTDANTGIFFPAADTIAFSEGGAESMRIDSSGNLGIGTTTPTTKLDVNGPASVTSFTGATRLGLTIKGSTGATDYSGIDFIGGTGSTNLTARIAVLSASSGSYLQFGTSNSYASGITNTAVTIDFNGNLMAGTTGANGRFSSVASGAASAGYFQSVNNHGIYSESTGTGYGLYGRAYNNSYGGVIGFDAANGTYGILGFQGYGLATNGSINIAGTIYTSDARLKENIVTLKNALNTICQLNPVSFDWKKNSATGISNDNKPKPDYGMIAQEVEKILPIIVTEATIPSKPKESNCPDSIEDELGSKKGIDYSRLIPFLTAAIQELNAKVDAQALEIATLKAK